MDRFTLIKTFVLVAEKGSFSGVATLLNLTQSQVSKMVKRLEDDLRVALFNRTTRKISLTEEGQRFLVHAREILDRFEQAQEDLSSHKGEPKGKLRVLTSDGTGRTVFLDVLEKFLIRYPFIQIHHIMSDKFINITEHQIDVALWLGEIKDTSYKARKIGLARRISVAAPAYLKERGTPKKPEDIYHHDCIVFSGLSDFTGLGQKMIWRYQCPHSARIFDIEVTGRYTTDNTSIVRDAAIKGLGIYQGPDYLFTEYLKEGRLVEILKEYSFEPFPMHFIYNAQGYVPSRLRVFMDFFAHEFSLNPVVA